MPEIQHTPVRHFWQGSASHNDMGREMEIRPIKDDITQAVVIPVRLVNFVADSYSLAKRKEKSKQRDGLCEPCRCNYM